jgi:hypothetical protein
MSWLANKMKNNDDDPATDSLYYLQQEAENPIQDADIFTNNDTDDDVLSEAYSERSTISQIAQYEQQQIRLDRQSDLARINNMSDNFFSFAITLIATPGTI